MYTGYSWGMKISISSLIMHCHFNKS